MASTITNLIPDLFASLDTVSRELVGFIPAVSSDMTFERAAIGQTVRSPVTPASTASDVTPAVTPPDDGDQTIANVSMAITKARRVPVRWNGEQSRGLNNNGPGRSAIMQGQFAQAMRTLVNEIEADLAGLHIAASRAYGTAGTTPFATAGDYSDGSNVLKILKDNGAPGSDNHLIIDTTAGASFLGKQVRADMSGETLMQRQGILLPLHGMDIRESGQVKVAGTNVITGTVTVTGANAKGATTIGLTTAAGAAVSAVAGDVVTFAGDSNKYVVTAAATIGASTTGNIVIAAPGLRVATTGSEAVSGVAASTRNMAFTRSAIHLATRAPALPEEGDSAEDRQIITDPRSGLSFEIAMYKQYRQVQYEVSIAYGVKAVKPEHMALLLG